MGGEGVAAPAVLVFISDMLARDCWTILGDGNARHRFRTSTYLYNKQAVNDTVVAGSAEDKGYKIVSHFLTRPRN